MFRESIKAVVCIVLIGAAFGITDAKNNKKHYKSEFGQDKFLNEVLFKGKPNGVFLDIGAHDGVTGSNTWFCEKKLNWTGICFEPIEDLFEKLSKNRNCICVQGAVADKDGMATFRQVIPGPGRSSEMLSGIETLFDPRAIQRIETEIQENGGSYKLIHVPTYELTKILSKHNINHIDFLSLDIEGGELEVLKTIDFKKFYIAAIAVENNYKMPEIRSFLESKGFRYITMLTVDEIYINKNETFDASKMQGLSQDTKSKSDGREKRKKERKKNHKNKH